MGKIFRTSDIFLVPNLITITRLILMVPLLMSYYFDYMIYFYILLLITIISDFLDGILARRLNQISELGKILDPLADNLTLFLFSIILSMKGLVPIEFCVFYFIRQLLLLIMSLIYLPKIKGVRGSSFFGKWGVGILTLGLGVHQSGLAERLAVHIIRFAGGSPKILYVQMLATFAGLTFALPSASTRGAIMVHIYEEVMERWGVEKASPLNKAVMIAMGGLNRLGSTALLAGGITPVVASAVIAGFGMVDDFSWTKWFILMAVPFYLILIFGGLWVYLAYRSGFTLPDKAEAVELKTGPIQSREIRAGLIAVGTALLWFTDFAHGLHPAVPALIAMTVILMPGIGILTWREFESNMSWTNFFVIASSISLTFILKSSRITSTNLGIAPTFDIG